MAGSPWYPASFSMADLKTNLKTSSRTTPKGAEVVAEEQGGFLPVRNGQTGRDEWQISQQKGTALQAGSTDTCTAQSVHELIRKGCRH